MREMDIRVRGHAYNIRAGRRFFNGKKAHHGKKRGKKRVESVNNAKLNFN